MVPLVQLVERLIVVQKVDGSNPPRHPTTNKTMNMKEKSVNGTTYGVGVVSIGVKAPIVREGDDVVSIVRQSIIELPDEFEVKSGDIIGITESLIARSQGNYCTVDDICVNLMRHNNGEKLPIAILYHPIASRNRFSLILKGIAKASEKVIVVFPSSKIDEVGNETDAKHRFTGINYSEFYSQLIQECGAESLIAWEDVVKFDKLQITEGQVGGVWVIDCRCHNESTFNTDVVDGQLLRLNDIMSVPTFGSGYNAEFGVLGSNKASEDKLKLFPRRAETIGIVEDIKSEFKRLLDVDVEVFVFGDGCFKDPVGGIWEFADPAVCVAYTHGLSGTPNEVKIKNLADDKFANLHGEELSAAIAAEVKNKKADLKGCMDSQGTTPRRISDLVGSLADLTTGSGDRGTPIVLIKNYFKNYSD